MAYESAELEIQIKGTRIADPNAAHQMSRVEFTNIERLYTAHGNPYEGQITDVIQCDKVFAPQKFLFPLGGREVSALLVGANERRLFGACSRDQVAYWAAYFNFNDQASKHVIEARVFAKTSRPGAAQIRELSKRLKRVCAELFVKAGA